LKQSCLDVEHIFLVDDEHRGLKFANQQFYRYRNVPKGRYVWALDDDDIVNDPYFVERIRELADEEDPDVIVVKTIHEHTGLVHPQPEIFDIDWVAGERPDRWVGGGYCVVVRKDVWQRHLEPYFEGQGEEWATGGDWHFITSLLEDSSLSFASCDIVAGRQPQRGYGNKTEDCSPDWFEHIAHRFGIEHVTRSSYRIDYRSRDLSGIGQFQATRPLRILQLAQWDWAGCAAMLAQALNEHTPHIARSVRWKEEGTFDFPTDIVAPSQDTLRKFYEWADVIHIHDSAPIPRNFEPKPTVITMHGSKYRKSPKKYRNIAANRNWFLTVATPDLTGVHGAPWMPDTRTGLPAPIHTIGEFTVLHCPSIRANKGTEAVLRARDALDGVRFELVEDVTWQECLRTKAQFKRGVLVDQFEWGYGCNAIEAWAYGMPVISNAIGRNERAFDSLFGYFPFLRATPDSLVEAIKRLRDPITYQQFQGIGIGHYQRYHNPKATAGIACEFYERVRREYAAHHTQALDLPKGAKVGSAGLVLLRYRGRNYGLMTYVGSKTGQRYHFSAAERLRYVDARDVPKMLQMERHTRKIFEVAED
jgi:hypothetical protein